MAEKLGTNDPSSAVRPRYSIVIDDEKWGEALLHARVEQSGLNRNGTFTLDFDLDVVGSVDENGAVTEDSRLGKLLTPHLDPFRNIVKIYCGYVEKEEDSISEDQLTLVMDGVIDTVNCQFDKAMVTVRGRDYSAVLQESFTHAQFRNQSVPDVVRAIAEKHELKVDIDDSGTQVGTVFDTERIGIENVPSQGYNDWELLCKFAEHDGYVIFVQDGTLHYKKVEDGEDTLIFEYGVNIQEIEANKNFTTSTSRVTVELTSVRQQQKDAVTVRSGASAGSGGYGKGDAAIFRYTDIPNRDPETLQAMADALAILLAQHEQVVTVVTTGHPSQNLRNKMQVKGTGTVFDEDYRIVTINWEFGGMEVGWHAEISGLKLPKGATIRTHRQRQARNGGITSAE